LLDSGTVVVGGHADLDDLYIAPTVLVDVAWDSPIMQEEVFSPILPILEIRSVQGVIDWVNRNPHPLGLYVFAQDNHVVDQILSMTESGDAVVNDCSLHPLVPEVPFGGVGNSGMGKYHGYWGFEAFTNARGVLYHSPRIDPGVRYPHTPNTASNEHSNRSCPSRARPNHAPTSRPCKPCSDTPRR
jgi:aldehyde dehydrogenase (NAD+)